MDSISTRLLAQKLDTAESQLYLWIERDKLNVDTDAHGTRIVRDEKFERVVVSWRGADGVSPEEAARQAYNYTAPSQQDEIRARRERAHRLRRRGWSINAIAQRIGRSKSTAYYYLQQPDPADPSDS